MRRLFDFAALSLICASCAPSETCTLSTDALCPDAAAQACADGSPAFWDHARQLNAQDRAQIAAQIEMLGGCGGAAAEFRQMADEAYAAFGAVFYADEQPWIEIRAKRALKEIEDNSKYADNAAHYLRNHLENKDNRKFLADNLELLKAHAASDDVFGILAEIGDSAVLAQLCDLPPTAERDKMLIARWPELPPDARLRALESYVSANWLMQTSGSSQLPQYLVFDWAKYSLPNRGKIPDFAVSAEVDSIKIRNEEVKRGEWRAASSLNRPALRAPGSRHARIDLSPWLTTAETHRIAAKAHIYIWPEDIDETCLTDRASCAIEPLARIASVFDKNYRVFAGVDTGAPHRVKNEETNRAVMESLSLELCNETKCIKLFGKKPIPANEILEVVQGHDFYISATFEDAPVPVASRLMARMGEGKAWREIATFYGDAPTAYRVASRGDIELGTLCAAVGHCKLQLQLRPSLRMARRDPSIARYFGANIDLGEVTLDIKNLTAQQLWEGI